jgi:Repeat of unknown function (DUF5648)
MKTMTTLPLRAVHWLGVLWCVATISSAMAAIIEMPNVRVEKANGADVSTLSTYEPFNVIATFSKPYCFSETYPLYASTTLKNNVLSLVLSHLKAGPCLQRRTLPVGGLHPGTYTIRVSITDDDLRNTYEVEVGSTSITVGLGSSVNGLLGFATARIDGGTIKPYGTYAPADAPITVTTLTDNFFILNEQSHWLELTDGKNRGTPSFIAYALTGVGPALPTSMVKLYVLRYPTPFLGQYFTTSESAARALQRQWYPQSPELPRAGLAVLASNNGTCPLGAAPVYQLFHPKAVAHRWTMDNQTYSILAENGYTAEGVAFCSPVIP